MAIEAASFESAACIYRGTMIKSRFSHGGMIMKERKSFEK